MSEKKEKAHVEPALGERRAVTGYYSQYRVSAALVIKGLRDSTLNWIAVADPKAGRVDDFQIASENCVDAYQFKWSRYPGSFSFNDLIKDSDSSPSLINQLADGWQKLKKLHYPKRVIVHLVTNETASVSPGVILPKGDPAPEPAHFGAFIEQAWKPAHTTSLEKEIKIGETWRVTWVALQEESGLSTDEFELFVRDCEFEFGSTLPEPKDATPRDAEIYEIDLNHVTEKLFRAVYEPKQIVRLERDELLNFLGWKRRFEFRNRHEFPVDEVLYHPIEESKQKLESALTENAKGYIAVLGSPGSGKSTLLTQTLRYFPQRIVRYYAFVPDVAGANLRGESQNFLNDLIAALENAGFRRGYSPRTPDIGHLREQLHEQLRLLHQDFLATGTKTIILIDGLDHIPREQHPIRSLLTDMPLPEEIPSGILFVLGSQTDELDELPTAIQTEIRSAERRIELGPLSREAIRSVIKKTSLVDLVNTEQIANIERLSNGHPLALVYLLRQLEAADSREKASEILQQTVPYDGKIADYYQSFWREIDHEDDLADLLGFIARMRGGVDFNWIRSWASHPITRRLQRLFAHLFRIEENGKWYFFHNSFRLFLIDRTARIAQGEFDEARDREIHFELAQKYARSKESYNQWEEIFHLYQAGANEELLRKATPVFFREQFLNFRSIEAVRADILLAIRAAGRQRDVVALVRQMLTDAEMAQRGSNTERLPIISILIALGETTTAVQYLRDGARLRVTAESAMESSIDLAKRGFQQEALSVFELAEPLEYLSGTKELNSLYNQDEYDLLKISARSATYFRPVTKIIEAIHQISVATEVHHQADGGDIEETSIKKSDNNAEATAKSKQLQNELIYEAGLELLAQDRWDDAQAVKNELLIDEKGKYLCFLLQVHSWRRCHGKGDDKHAREILYETIEQIDSYNVGSLKQTIIAEALLSLGDNEKASEWLGQAPPLTPITMPDFQVSFAHFRPLLRHVRLLYVFGDSRTPAHLIPLPKELKGQAAAYCQRGVCVIAEIAAKGWKGQQLDRASLRQKTFQLLRLFYHGRLENRDEWSEWYPFISGIKNEFYEQLIIAIAMHGREAIQDLAEDFAKEWELNRRYWGTETIQETTLTLFGKGAKKDWAVRQLERLSHQIAGEETYTRIEKSADLAAAWLELGEPEQARNTLLQTLSDSSSTGEKDYQLNAWLEWLRRINRLEPEQATKRVAWFAEAIVDLERNGGPAADAAYDLLEITFEWSPRRAVRLFLRFVEKGIVNFNEAIKRLLLAALKNSCVSEISILILREFVLPFANPDESIIELIVSGLLKRQGKGAMLQFAVDFITETQIRALPENRRVWLRYIARALIKNEIPLVDAGLSEENLEQEESSSSRDEFSLKDGSILTLSEVQRRCRTFAGFIELIQQDQNSYFYWDAIAKDLLNSLTDPTEVLKVAEYFDNSKTRTSAPIINRAAKRLLDLDDEQNAEALAGIALTLSRESGWAFHLGGGTKIEAHQTLVEIGGERARYQAFDDLIRDLSGDYRYTSSIVRDLDEILPVLTDQIPEREVWAEVEQYVHNTFSSTKPEKVDSGWLNVLDDDEKIEDNSTNALNDFVCSHIAHPVNILAYAAQFTYLELLLSEGEPTMGYISRLLSGGEREQEAVMMILDAASIKNNDIVGNFRDELLSITLSPNFALRFIAAKLLNKVDISASLSTTLKTDLPSIYHLQLPPPPDFDSLWKIETDENEAQLLPTTKNSYELLKIILLELRVAASEARLPIANIVERAAQIASHLAAQDEWCILGETKMQNLFARAHIKTQVYRKPYAIMARHALFHLVAELFDAGLLAEERLEHWDWILQYYDPLTFFNRPIARPDFVALISGWEQKAFVELQVAAAERQINIFPQERLVIFGEYTKIKTLQWETPTVIRQSLICSEEFVAEDDENRFFPRNLIVQIEKYPFKSGGHDEKDATVVWHWERMSDSPYTQWVAFNPELARSLGWDPSADRPFGWQNGSGELMVWSIFWQDGLFEERPPHFHNEVGEGWAVLGTSKALAEVIDHLKIPLMQRLRVEQQWHVDNNYRNQSVISKRKVVFQE